MPSSRRVSRWKRVKCVLSFFKIQSPTCIVPKCLDYGFCTKFHIGIGLFSDSIRGFVAFCDERNIVVVVIARVCMCVPSIFIQTETESTTSSRDREHWSIGLSLILRSALSLFWLVSCQSQTDHETEECMFWNLVVVVGLFFVIEKGDSPSPCTACLAGIPQTKA